MENGGEGKGDPEARIRNSATVAYFPGGVERKQRHVAYIPDGGNGCEHEMILITSCDILCISFIACAWEFTDVRTLLHFIDPPWIRHPEVR